MTECKDDPIALVAQVHCSKYSSLCERIYLIASLNAVRKLTIKLANVNH